MAIGWRKINQGLNSGGNTHQQAPGPTRGGQTLAKSGLRGVGGDGVGDHVGSDFLDEFLGKGFKG